MTLWSRYSQHPHCFEALHQSRIFRSKQNCWRHSRNLKREPTKKHIYIRDQTNSSKRCPINVNFLSVEGSKQTISVHSDDSPTATQLGEVSHFCHVKLVEYVHHCFFDSRFEQQKTVTQTGTVTLSCLEPIIQSTQRTYIHADTTQVLEDQISDNSTFWNNLILCCHMVLDDIFYYPVIHCIVGLLSLYTNHFSLCFTTHLPYTNIMYPGTISIHYKIFLFITSHHIIRYLKDVQRLILFQAQ